MATTPGDMTFTAADRATFQKLGRRGGRARALVLTRERRVEIALSGVAAARAKKLRRAQEQQPPEVA